MSGPPVGGPPPVRPTVRRLRRFVPTSMRRRPGRRFGDVDHHRGRCACCGLDSVFALSEPGAPADRQFRCERCDASLRFRAEAQVLIDELGDGRQRSLRELVRGPGFRRLSVYHVGSTGPVRGRLRRLDRYVESRFDPDAPTGATLADGFRNEDLQQLTFDDESFDLVVSSHVLEHVPDPWAAFGQVHRVLRPGGRMVHSIPARHPLRAETVVRAEVTSDGGIVHHEPPRYHRSPEGEPALVYTDFGADVRPRVAALGFDVTIRRPHLQVGRAWRNLVLVGRKVSRGSAP